jgi:hypothetical protein
VFGAGFRKQQTARSFPLSVASRHIARGALSIGCFTRAAFISARSEQSPLGPTQRPLGGAEPWGDMPSALTAQIRNPGTKGALATPTVETRRMVQAKVRQKLAIGTDKKFQLDKKLIATC